MSGKEGSREKFYTETVYKMPYKEAMAAMDKDRANIQNNRESIKGIGDKRTAAQFGETK